MPAATAPAPDTRPDDLTDRTDLPARTDSAGPLERDAPPCRTVPDDLWFSDDPAELERAKMLCAHCPWRRSCLAGALARREYCGVWGGEILDRGSVIARKRPRGRPSKADLARDAEIASARAAAGVA